MIFFRGWRPVRKEEPINSIERRMREIIPTGFAVRAPNDRWVFIVPNLATAEFHWDFIWGPKSGFTDKHVLLVAEKAATRQRPMGAREIEAMQRELARKNDQAIDDLNAKALVTGEEVARDGWHFFKNRGIFIPEKTEAVAETV